MHKDAGITNRKATLHRIEGIPDQLPKPWHTPPIYPFPLYNFLFISILFYGTAGRTRTATSFQLNRF